MAKGKFTRNQSKYKPITGLDLSNYKIGDHDYLYRISADKLEWLKITENPTLRAALERRELEY